MVGPALLQDTLCRLPSRALRSGGAGEPPGSWIAATVPWPGAQVDVAQCRHAVGAAHGVTIEVMPCQRIPLTEQGKPDRAAIRLLGMAAGAAG
jgi:fatty-acyl-CoA synthase